MNDKEKYILSTYEEISLFSTAENEGGSKIFLVKNTLDEKLYLKKIINNGDYDLYLSLMEISKKDKRLPEIIHVIKDNDKVITIEKYYNCSSLQNVIEKLDKDSFIFAIKQVLEIIQVLSENTPTIIHRDIKPDNILVEGDFSKIHLVDFGAARRYCMGAQRDTILLGTEQFAAPEQYGFSQSDVRTDIYAVGAMMKYILENSNIEFENDEELRIKSIIKKATSMEPNDRYQTPTEMIDSLDMEYDFKSENNYRRFLLPGFRSGKIENMICAIVGYLFMGYLTITMSSEMDNNILITKVCVAVMFITETIFFTNYCGIKDGIQLVKKDKSYKKIFSHIVIGVSIFLACVLLDCILQGIFK